MTPNLDTRLQALEERVAQLEASSEDVQAPSSGVQRGYAETFWALEGLRSRSEAPGAVLFTGAASLPNGTYAEWQHGRGVADLLGLDWERAAGAFAALGHPTRLALVRAVADGTDTVAEMTELEGMGTSGQVYHHLRQLVAAGWLRQSHGRYDIPADRIVPLLNAIALAVPSP